MNTTYTVKHIQKGLTLLINLLTKARMDVVSRYFYVRRTSQNGGSRDALRNCLSTDLQE